MQDLEVTEVFQKVRPGTRYRLRSMVAYYGAHYFAFVLHPATRRWTLFDDAHISEVLVFSGVPCQKSKKLGFSWRIAGCSLLTTVSPSFADITFDKVM